MKVVTRPLKAYVKEVIEQEFFSLNRKNHSEKNWNKHEIAVESSRLVKQEDKSILLINIITESQSVAWFVAPNHKCKV